MNEKVKNILVLLLIVGVVRCYNFPKCPKYCTCFKDYDNGLKTVQCISKRLINIDLGIPFEVQSLDLSNNSISVLDDKGFNDLGLLDLIEISLKHNSIRSIGLRAFAGLSHLRYVDLTENHLHYILPWTFQDNPSMKQLILTNNPIGHTENEILLNISTLEVLEVANCRFAHLSREIFSHMQNLQVINISGNQLIGLDIQVLQPLRMLRVIDVTRNPWSCDNNMKQMEDWLSSKSVQLIGSTCDIDNLTKEVAIHKLEKIISMVEPDQSSSSEEELWVENENKTCGCLSNTTSISNTLLERSRLNIPSPWIFVIGFQFGALFALFGAFVWYACRRPKYVAQPMNEIQPIMMMEPICPETPPPSYRDLFSV